MRVALIVLLEDSGQMRERRGHIGLVHKGDVVVLHRFHEPLGHSVSSRGAHGWLSRYYWDNLAHVQQFVTQWMWQYNHERPNIVVGAVTPRQRLMATANLAVAIANPENLYYAKIFDGHCNFDGCYAGR